MNTKNIKTYTCFKEWLQEKELIKQRNHNKKLPWRKILNSMGYHRCTSSWGAPYWINSTGVVLVESLIPSNSMIEYVKEMEEYEMIFTDYYMEMKSLWTEGDIV